MPVRPALKLNVGGLLSVDVAEPGALTSCTITIRNSAKVEVVSAAAATAVGSRLTYSASAFDTKGRYLAIWSYTANGVAYERPQALDVVEFVVRPTLTQAGLVGRYGLLEGVRGRMTLQQAIDAAWVDVFEAVEAAGNIPNRIIDPRPLEVPHAAYAAWRFALNLESGSAQTGGQWQAWALDRHAEALSLLTSALRHVDYDTDDDGNVSEGEQQTNRARRLLSR